MTYDCLECLEFKSIRINVLRIGLVNHFQLPFDCLAFLTLSLSDVGRFLASENTLDGRGSFAQDQTVQFPLLPSWRNDQDIAIMKGWVGVGLGRDLRGGRSGWSNRLLSNRLLSCRWPTRGQLIERIVGNVIRS
jgi:hypothetical protein